MPNCPNCGKMNLQTDGVYCSFCGRTLKTTNDRAVSSSEEPHKVPETLYDMQRLEKATKRVERLGYVVAAELIALTVLVILLLYTFYG